MKKGIFTLILLTLLPLHALAQEPSNNQTGATFEARVIEIIDERVNR